MVRGSAGNRRPLLLGVLLAAGTLLLLDVSNVERGSAHLAYEQAEDVLTEGALVSFRRELPHKLQRGTDAVLRPLRSTVPDINGPRQLASLRRDLAAVGSGVTLIPEEGDVPFRKWRTSLIEVCRVLGFREAAADTADFMKGADAAPVCPELWVDEAWPPSPKSPKKKTPVPVWSMGAEKTRGLIVLQATLLNEYPPSEIKALMGFELGRSVFVQLPVAAPDGWGKRAGQAYVSLRLLHAWQLVNRKRALLPFLSRRSPVGGILPSLLGMQRRPSFSFMRQPSAVQVLAPWLSVAGEAGLLEVLQRFKGFRGRSLVLTLDRVAAVAAGDAQAAASAVMRSHGLLPPDVARQPEELSRVLHAAAATADRQAWAWRRDAALQNPQEPRAEVRVLELLRWADSEAAKRLLALGHMRRRGRPRTRSWWEAFRGIQYNDEGELEFQRSWLQRFPWLGYTLLVALFALPFATSVDAVRWASLCTLVLTCLGILLPVLGSYGLPQLPPLVGAGLAASLVGYAAFVWSIWWNHLLGGWRRWAKLSAELSAQLLDQADVTAGIAYLARDWAELARRSLAALDQELCGSWRTSLHELASKLTDLRQEVEVSNRNGHGRTNSLPSLPPPPTSSTALVPLKLQRHQSAALPPSPLPLWRKVDRAVQRAAQVEAARMRCAVDADADQIQAMQTWWRTGGRTVSAVELSLAVGGATPQETLGDLVLAERLHVKFPYPSFHAEDLGSDAEAAPSSDDFRRLEKALQQNLQSLQDLRGRLTPWENTKTALFWTWADVHAITIRFQKALHWPPPKVPGQGKDSKGPNIADNPKDQQAEFRMMSCLFLACFTGVFGAFALCTRGRWGWVVGTLSFGVANAVLLLNYSRLYLPHVRRRFEQRLAELSRQQELLLQEVNMVQRNSQRARMVHNKAAIFLQSVNVIRNINYLALCIKTEVQRAAAGDRQNQSRQQRHAVAACGLQLLLALLPHSDPQWRQEAFEGEDCAHVAALLYGPRRGSGRGPFSGLLSKNEHKRMLASFEESQKRLWILFRMVHLSSVLPCEVHGQLGALVDRYLRPVLVERRVPLDRRPTLEAHDSGERGALLDSAQSGGKNAEVYDIGVDEKEAFISPSKDKGSSMNMLRDISADQESTWSTGGGSAGRRASASGASDAGSLDEDSLNSFYAGSSASFSSRRSERPQAEDPSKVLKKLIATRTDIARVLARLPAASLVGPSARSPQSDSVLGDIFSSIILALPNSCLTSPGNLEAALRDAAEGRIVVAAATGYRYADRSYPWQGLQTSLMLEVSIAPADAIDLGVNVGGTGLAEVAVPLTMMVDEEPPQIAATSAWGSLSTLHPRRFSEAALRARRRALRRAKDVLRSMGGRKSS